MCLENVGLQFIVDREKFAVEWNMGVSSLAKNHSGICRLNSKGILRPAAHSGIPEVALIQGAAIAASVEKQ